MILAVCFFTIFNLPVAHATSWDDFSNNLATDLAPFLSLFGEQVTKQYLSESITFLDYFIFAMAPMGILTAVVSAIRVCGGPSLRAFIGRGQEGGGNAEAELCSSTSRDVCELYHNGGIARVFGRPKILEVVYDPDNRDLSDGTAGIYTFQEYLGGRGKAKWRSLKKAKGTNKERGKDAESAHEDAPSTTAFAPNLSLNIGITKQHPAVFWTVALGGLILQSGVLLFAVIVTYYLGWEKNGRRPGSYACPMTLVGTLLVCGGMFLCAFLVGQSTKEEVWCRNEDDKSDSSSIHWVQPGGQIIGDQTFDAFCYADRDDPKGHLKEYTISWKKSRSKNWEYSVWGAVGITVSGFVLQFVGLRGMHSAVSVAQLGVVMVMSIARAALRMRRLKPDANSFAEYPDEVIGHEIDWLALRIGERDIQDGLSLGVSPSSLAGSLPTNNRYRYFWKFCGALEPRMRFLSKPPSNFNKLNTAAKLLAYRTRLAQLTESASTQSKSARSARHFDFEMVEVRRTSQQLALAIESTVNTIFSKSYKIKKEWESVESMLWDFNCEVSAKDIPGHSTHGKVPLVSRYTLSLQLNRESKNASVLANSWKLQDKREMEGLLGLWLWSLKSDPAVEKTDPQNHLRTSRATEIPIQRIVSTDQKTAETDLKIWLGDRNSSMIEDAFRSRPIDQDDPSSIWERKKDGSFSPRSYKLPQNLQGQIVRLFGWYAAESLQVQSSEAFKVWSVPTDGSLLSCCAWEVFGSFVKSIMGVVDEVGSIHIQEDDPDFRVGNRLVSEIVKSFTESQLGSESEALLCILPAVIPRLAMPSSESALMTAVKSANQHRRKKEFEKAEAILKWAWTTCAVIPSHNHRESPEDLTELAAVALGELYRFALRDPDTVQFGNDGIKWLLSQRPSRSQPPTNSLDEIILRYGTIKEALSSPEDRANVDVLSAVKDHNLTETLICLTRRTLKMTNEVRGDALCLAAKQGWVEVVCSLLELATEPDYKDTDSRTALSHAAESGSIHVVRELMDWGAFPNSEDKERRTPLSWAAEKGHETIAKTLLTDIRTFSDSRDNNGWTPLSWAAMNGREAIVKMLLDKNADIEAKDKDQRTPLSHAAERGHETIVKMLLDKNADIEAKGMHGRTALSHAAERGHEMIVRMLLDKNADIEAKDKDRRTPLSHAAERGHEMIVRMLLDKNADIEAKGMHGRTALSHAAERGHGTVVKMLFNKNADIEAKDKDGRTALSHAAERGQGMIVKTLLDKNADIEARDKDGRTALSHAAERGHEMIVRMLLDKNADIEAKGMHGRTALSHAAERGHGTVVKMLFNKNADIEAKDKDGRTPLSHATERGQEMIVKTLLDKNADIEARDKDGRTALSHAAERGHGTIVKMLLDKNADIEAKGMHGRTALSHAAERGHGTIVKMLLDKNADIEPKDKDGRTALSHAGERGHETILKMLSEKRTTN